MTIRQVAHTRLQKRKLAEALAFSGPVSDWQVSAGQIGKAAAEIDRPRMTAADPITPFSRRL